MSLDVKGALIEQATIALHDALTSLAEAGKGPLVVRRLAEHRAAVLVDIKQHGQLCLVDRFQLEYSRHTVGNSGRGRPATVTAHAGALNRWQFVATFEDRDPLEIYEWMLCVVAQHGGVRI